MPETKSQSDTKPILTVADTLSSAYVAGQVMARAYNLAHMPSHLQELIDSFEAGFLAEFEPPLDPKPWKTPRNYARQSYNVMGLLTFDPRPEYDQERSHYA